MRAPSGMFRASTPSGYPEPLNHSWWGLIRGASLCSGRALLEQDVVPDPALPHVVQEPGPLDLLDLRLGQLHDATHGLGDAAHPVRVATGVPITRVDRIGQRADRLLEQLTRLDVTVVCQPRREERNDEECGGPPADAVGQREDLRHEPSKRSQTDEVGPNPATTAEINRAA